MRQGEVPVGRALLLAVAARGREVDVCKRAARQQRDGARDAVEGAKVVGVDRGRVREAGRVEARGQERVVVVVPEGWARVRVEAGRRVREAQVREEDGEGEILVLVVVVEVGESR